jgi:hypothetical protein
MENTFKNLPHGAYFIFNYYIKGFNVLLLYKTEDNKAMPIEYYKNDKKILNKKLINTRYTLADNCKVRRVIML